jgi:hypothetical protein
MNGKAERAIKKVNKRTPETGMHIALTEENKLTLTDAVRATGHPPSHYSSKGIAEMIIKLRQLK